MFRLKLPHIYRCLTHEWRVLQSKVPHRTYLSETYACQDAWNKRLESPLLSKINHDELYYDMDRKYQNQKTVSAIDLDIFVNSLDDDTFLGEVRDLLYKLRLTPECKNMLESTGHAVIRLFAKNEQWETLLEILDDRINYGVFVSQYDANYLMNIFYDKKHYANATRVACQLMLQEDFSHPLTRYFAALNCCLYLQNPENWPEPAPPEPEPKEEIKIRVKFLRNPYFDDHFDLKDPRHLTGKTLWMIGTEGQDCLHLNLQLLGLAMYDKIDQANDLIGEMIKSDCQLYQDVLHLVKDKALDAIDTLTLKSESLIDDVNERVRIEERNLAETDMLKQCELYSQWEKQRCDALEEQKQRILRVAKLKNIEESQKYLEDREKLLWFFENEDKIELEIDAKKVDYPKQWFQKKKKSSDDEPRKPVKAKARK